MGTLDSAGPVNNLPVTWPLHHAEGQATASRAESREGLHADLLRTGEHLSQASPAPALPPPSPHPPQTPASAPSQRPCQPVLQPPSHVVPLMPKAAPRGYAGAHFTGGNTESGSCVSLVFLPRLSHPGRVPPTVSQAGSPASRALGGQAEPGSRTPHRASSPHWKHLPSQEARSPSGAGAQGEGSVPLRTLTAPASMAHLWSLGEGCPFGPKPGVDARPVPWLPSAEVHACALTFLPAAHLPRPSRAGPQPHPRDGPPGAAPSYPQQRAWPREQPHAGCVPLTPASHQAREGRDSPSRMGSSCPQLRAGPRRLWGPCAARVLCSLMLLR